METIQTTSAATWVEQDKRILVVDDEMSLRAILSEVLADDGYDVTTAESGEEALDYFQQAPYPLVITDIVMGGISGIQLLEKIKQMHPDTQVVIMTSNASLDTAINALKSGAYDYLIKPFDEIEIVTALAHRVFENIRLNAENKTLIKLLKQKNVEMEQANKTLKELAIRDGLTGLFNHRHFQEILAIELMRSYRHERCFSLILIDVDNFKKYNDTHGHPEGDKLLKTLSEQMTMCFRRSDIVARYGGEEFVIILPETCQKGAGESAECLRKSIEEYSFDGGTSQPGGRLTVSAGVASYPDNGIDGSTLIEKADRALYRAKEMGRNNVCISD